MNATATQKIAARVAALVAAGMNPIEALKAVCPAADVDQMISDLYDQLRARAQ